MRLASLALSLALLAAGFAKDKPPVSEETLVLDPIKVRGNATSNFAIDIQIVVSPQTNKVITIRIAKVFENSDAADLDLQVGDLIVKVDGVPVEGMDPKIDFRSEIGKIFLNRKPGDTLKLEVLTRRIRDVTLRAHAGLEVR